MDNHLVFVSVYASFNKTFEELCEKNKYPYIIIESRLDDAVTALKRRFPTDFPAVIICRGVTAELIQRAYSNTVVITADPDDSDLIDALEQAKSYGNRIGCIVNRRMVPYNMLDSIKRLLNIKQLEVFTCDDSDDMEKAFTTAKKLNLDVMAGGGRLGSSLGIKYKIPTVFIASGVRTIWKAITKAWDILQYLLREHEQELMFNTVVSSMKDGIVSVRGNKLTMINPAAEKIFNLYSNQALGRSMQELSPDMAKYIELNQHGAKTIRINANHVLVEKIMDRKTETGQENILILHDVGHIQKMEQRVRNELYTKGLVAKHTLNDIVGTNAQMRRTIEEARIYAKTDANVLISGESGTGKELLTQGIHNASNRSNAPFVAINCAELPEPLLESELFGYVDGAFTGAKRGGKIGLLELAHKGTVFLDEINSTTLALQGKLLRAIQEKQVRRIGSDSMVPIDIRIISAVNVDMGEEIQQGRFRRDLYYRLNTLFLHAIPLRERPEDIVELAKHFCRMHSMECGCKPPVLSLNMCKKLQNAYWAGNVRELDNVIQRLCVLSSSTEDLDDLLMYCMQDIIPGKKSNEKRKDMISIPRGTLEEMEEELIQCCLEDAGGNRNIAARKLGISRSTLWRKLQKENDYE